MEAPMRALLAAFLIEYLRETGTMDYFPDLSGTEWAESIPQEIIDRFERELAKMPTGSRPRGSGCASGGAR